MSHFYISISKTLGNEKKRRG